MICCYCSALNQESGWAVCYLNASTPTCFPLHTGILGGGPLFPPPHPPSPTSPHLTQDQGGVPFPPSVSQASPHPHSPSSHYCAWSAQSPSAIRTALAQDVKSAHISLKWTFLSTLCDVCSCLFQLCFLLSPPDQSCERCYILLGPAFVNRKAWRAQTLPSSRLKSPGLQRLVFLSPEAEGLGLVLSPCLRLLMDVCLVATLSQLCPWLRFGWLPVWSWSVLFCRMSSEKERLGMWGAVRTVALIRFWAFSFTDIFDRTV